MPYLPNIVTDTINPGLEPDSCDSDDDMALPFEEVGAFGSITSEDECDSDDSIPPFHVHKAQLILQMKEKKREARMLRADAQLQPVMVELCPVNQSGQENENPCSTEGCVNYQPMPLGPIDLMPIFEPAPILSFQHVIDIEPLESYSFSFPVIDNPPSPVGDNDAHSIEQDTSDSSEEDDIIYYSE